jgi:hypothetical protein
VQELVAKQRDQWSQVSRLALRDHRSLQAEDAVRRRLARLARTRLPIVVGPWTGEVGFELLYWIPFLQWACRHYALDPSRLLVVSRGGVRPWYGHVGTQYEDAFAHATPSEFQQATEDRKKQHAVGAFDRRLVRRVMRARGLRHVHLLHPTLMYTLYKGFWRYDATVARLDAVARFRALPPAGAVSDVPAEVLAALPSEFVAARFYFSSCFPDTPENRHFATSVVEGLAAHTHVVLLNNDLVVDDHRDYSPAASGRIHRLSAQMRPETNLAVQTAVIARARAFVGTYGGYSYLAPLYGVNAVAFYSHATFKQHHLELAHRAFQRIGRARLFPVDVAQADSLARALAGTLSAPATATDAGGPP